MDKPHKIQIGGIKFSEELVHISLRSDNDLVAPASASLFKKIAEQQINIPFLCNNSSSNSYKTSFCIESSDFTLVQPILSQALIDNEAIKIAPSVGTCTIFPHRYSLSFIGQLLAVIEEFNFPLYSLSTSISAVAFNTDFHLLDQVADKLTSVLELPDNHAPFRQEFQLKQVQP